MNRPTRVPASSVVRMKSASNMMAKWYQKAFMPAPPTTAEKISDIPSAKVGAPPVRESRLASSTSFAAWASASGEMAKPKLVTAWEADSTVVPMTPPGELTAKKSPGSMMQAAMIAMTATKDSVSMAP